MDECPRNLSPALHHGDLANLMTLRLQGGRMRVLIVSPYTPPLLGGLECVAQTLARGLIDCGHEARIVGQFASGRHPLRERLSRSERERTFQVDGVPVTILRPVWPRVAPAPVVYALLWIAPLRPVTLALLERACLEPLRTLAEGVDVVHYLGTGMEALGFSASAAARAAGASFVVQPAIHPGTWGHRALDVRLYRGADAVLAFTRSEAELLRQLGVSPARIHVAPGSVDPPPASDPQGFRQRHGIAGPMVVFLGRRSRSKGIDRLIEAWPSVRVAFPSATLVLVGPSDESCESGNGRQQGVLDVVDASEQEKHDALAACDLFCMPSLGESFGIAVFEAWSHGKPVVVSDLPALRESVEASRGGVAVSPVPRLIAESIVALLQDPSERAQMGERGRAFAAAHTESRALAAAFAAYSAARGERRFRT